MFTFSAARTVVSVATAIALTVTTGALQAGTTVRGYDFGARLADVLEIHVFQGQNAGFVIGRPGHDFGFELYGTAGDPTFFFNTGD